MIGSMVAIVAADLTVTGVTAAELAPAAEAFAALPLCCITEDNNFISSYCSQKNILKKFKNFQKST